MNGKGDLGRRGGKGWQFQACVHSAVHLPEEASLVQMQKYYILLGGDFKNKQTTKQLFEQEYNCANNCLSSKTSIISIKLFHQEYNCFIIKMIV